MTLVISSIEDGQINFLADTVISFDAALSRKPYHALKILFLSPTTVLAFSGGHERSLEIFFRLHAIGADTLQLSELANMIASLRVRNNQSGTDVAEPPDFLLARTIPTAVVYRINDQGVCKCPDKGWIGNPQAAAKVSRSTAKNGFELSMAVSDVINDPSFVDVGGHLVAMRGNSQGFEFVPRMLLISPKYIPVEGWNTVDFGSAQTGGFAFTTIIPRDRGQNGFGIFFFQGGFGLFFHVDPEKKKNEVLKGYARTPEEFVAVLEAEIGFAVCHCGSLG